MLLLLISFVVGRHFKVVKRDAVLICEFFVSAMVGNNGGDFNKPLVRKIPREDIVDTVRRLGGKDGHTRLFIGEVELPTHGIFRKNMRFKLTRRMAVGLRMVCELRSSD